MNKKIFALGVAVALSLGLAFRYSLDYKLDDKDISRMKLSAIYCSPDWSKLNADTLAESMVPLPGWGNYRWNISSSSDSAVFYFNQGINMYYAFHIIESMASFKKAQMFDENNPMILWGQALAYGPNINDFAYAPSDEAYMMAKKAEAYTASLSDRDKMLVSAMQVRYSPDSTISREELNTRYAAAMKKVYEKYRYDADAGALYADALMLLHPWEYWKHDGAAHPWTPEILTVLENVLKINPKHPGANHYYIHATEASPNPGRALASADRLGELMPQVSHMVHMPSHIYIRTGNYNKGVRVNEMSVSGYNTYLSLFPAVKNNVPLYLIHNLHMQAACAMFNPNYAYSIKSAKECAGSFDTSFLSMEQPIGNFIQYVYMTPSLVNVRYGKWEEIINADLPDKKHAYAYALSLWSKGMAYAGKSDWVKAGNILSEFKDAMQHGDLKIRMIPFNAPVSSLLVAEKILEGNIKMNIGELLPAISLLEEAVRLEDRLIYTEPRDWLIPSRHFLAAALIKNNALNKAEKVLLQDLAQNPSNFYALSALDNISSQRGKKKDILKYHAMLKESFKNSDLKGPSLLY